MGQLFYNNDGKVTGAAISSGEHFRHPPKPAPWEPSECSIEQLPSEFAWLNGKKIAGSRQDTTAETHQQKDYLIDTDGKKIELKK